MGAQGRYQYGVSVIKNESGWVALICQYDLCGLYRGEFARTSASTSPHDARVKGNKIVEAITG